MMEIILLLFTVFILGIIGITLYKQVFQKEKLSEDNEEEIDDFFEKKIDHNALAETVKKVELLAKILYKEDYCKFEKKLMLLQKSKKSIFQYKNNSYNNPFKSKDYDDCYDIEDYLLTRANYDGKLEAIDWKGEDNKDQFLNYVIERLKVYGITNFNVDIWNESLQMFNHQLPEYELIKNQFSLWSKKLEEIKMYLVFIDDGSDTYYPMIVDDEDFRLLVDYKTKKIKIVDSSSY